MDETIEVKLSTDITVEDDLNVTSGNNNDIEIIEEDSEFEVSFQKREYVITGDDMYIPLSYDESPQWLKDIINNITNFSLNQKLTEIGVLSDSLYALIDELNVAKNAYTQSIISSSDIDSRINAAITTLNSNLSENDATIVNLISTKATPTEASALALDVLTSSINNGQISSLVSTLQNTISTATSTLSNSIDVVHSEMTGSVEGTANGIQSLSSYVGIDPNTYDPDGTGMLAHIEILQKQNDGVIETISGTYDVIINPQDPNLAQLVIAAEPYATWKTADVSGINTRLSHIGDVYMKYIDNPNGSKEYVASYKFIRTVVDTTSPYSTDSDGFTWALILDQGSQDAYTQALNAYDLADNKRRVFTITPSGPYDVGDLWVKIVNGSNQIWKCHATREQLGYYNVADWSIASTDDTATVALQTGLADGTVTVKLTNAYVGTTPFLTYLTNEVDSKVGVYSGETAPVAGQPSGVAANDIYLWFTTASKVLASGVTQVYDITRTYKYSGSTWSEITTDSNITALADLADGKRTVFSDSVVPSGAVSRDIWIPSADVEITTSEMCTVAGGIWTTSCDIPKYLQGEIYQYSDTNKWITATRYSTLISNLASTVQSQVDSKIETHYQSTVPGPLTSANDGDYWYCTGDVIGNGTATDPQYKKRKVYKYTHVGALWTLTADVGGDAFDKADGKASIFTTSAKPNVYKKNDMLIVIANNDVGTYKAGVVLTASVDRTSGSFTASEWTKKINDTEDLVAFTNVINPKIATLQNQVDGKIEYFFYEKYNEPSTIIASATSESNALYIIDNQWNTQALKEAATGNVVYFKNTKNGYWYSGSTNSWLPITDTSMMDALAIAEKAKSTADGKVTIYSALYSDTRPTTGANCKFWYNESTSSLEYYVSSWTVLTSSTTPKLSVGDLVYVYGAPDKYSEKNTGFRYTGTGWASIVDGGIKATAKAITALDTSLTDPVNGAIVTATNAVKQDLVEKILPNGLATVESKWAFNSAIKLGTTTYESGFGLASNVAGNTGSTPRPTSGSEFWIRADKFKMIAANQTAASKAPFTVNATTGVIDFNGVVSFANVKDDAAKTALIKSISDAQDTANSAVSEISYIASDNKLTPVEKSSAQKEWDTIASEYTKNIAQAAAFGVSTTSYATAYNALNTYLNTVITTGVPALLASLTTISDIVGSTFRNKFKAYYDAKADLLNAISSGSRTENAITTIPNPIGGTYVGAATTTGIFVVKLPQLFTNTMMTLEIDVYNYAMNKSFTLKIAGYNSTSGWVNTSSNLIGSSSLEIPVRFAQNSTKCCIMIGDISSVWSHPKIKVKNCVFSHSNYEIDKWDNGWSISVATSLTGYTVTKTHTTGWQQEVQAALNDNTTVINGSNVTTGTISADRIDVNNLFSKNITYTGVITGGNKAGGGIIQSYNGKMTIDLVNGSIYIA